MMNKIGKCSRKMKIEGSMHVLFKLAFKIIDPIHKPN